MVVHREFEFSFGNNRGVFSQSQRATRMADLKAQCATGSFEKRTLAPRFDPALVRAQIKNRSACLQAGFRDQLRQLSERLRASRFH